MLKSTHLELNLPELADQYSVNHMNENTQKLDDVIFEAQENIQDLQDDTVAITNQEIDSIMNS